MPAELTEPQKARVQELECGGGARVYTYAYQGRSVIDAFRRYLTSDDPQKITPALRDFLMMVCGFIAHFDLAGFRSAYPHASLLLEELDGWSGEMRFLLQGQRPPARVYRDGMTDTEVCEGISALVGELRRAAEHNLAEAIGQAAREQVVRAAGLLGWIVVPHGFTLVAGPPTSGESESSAAPDLQRLAEARGMALVPDSQLF